MKIKLPVILHADDYHEFASNLELVNRIALPDNKGESKQKLNFAECGFYEGEYHAVLYEGKKPTAAETINLIMLDEKLNTLDKALNFFQRNELEFKMKDFNRARVETLKTTILEQNLTKDKAEKYFHDNKLDFSWTGLKQAVEELTLEGTMPTMSKKKAKSGLKP